RMLRLASLRLGRGGRAAGSVYLQHEPGIASLELDRAAIRRGDRLVGIEPVEHPADGRLTICSSLGVDRARDDETVDRTRHRHVVEAEPLGPLAAVLSGPHLVEAEDGST